MKFKLEDVENDVQEIDFDDTEIAWSSYGDTRGSGEKERNLRARIKET